MPHVEKSKVYDTSQLLRSAMRGNKALNPSEPICAVLGPLPSLCPGHPEPRGGHTGR
jgi:hypothetical protein